MLRTISELQSAFHLRASLIEQNFRDLTRQQHDDFTVEMDRRTLDIQARLWQDLEKIRAEYDRLIHTELRLLRQRNAAGSGSTAVSGVVAGRAAEEHLDIDWMRFAEQFRGSEERIREQQHSYIARFTGASGQILDIGCGRGEFLEVGQGSESAGTGHGSESRVRRAVPLQGPGGGASRPVRVSGIAGRWIAGRRLLLASSGASSAPGGCCVW